MGLGSTAKKLQTLGDTAEKMYNRVGELKEQLQDLRETVETTGDQVDHLEHRVERQEALLEAIATEHDVDVESALAEAGVDDSADEEVDDAESGAETGGDGAAATDDA